MESEKEIERRKWAEKEREGDEETGERERHIYNTGKEETANWGERQPQAETEKRESGGYKGAELSRAEDRHGD